MRISDWSSDVCSSDLDLEYAIGFKLFVRSKGSALTVTPEAEYFYHEVERSFIGVDALKKTADDIRNLSTGNLHIASLPALAFSFLQIGRAPCRERVCQSV